MYNILIAEDEPRIAAFIEKGLRRYGYNAAIAYSGNKALEMALSNEFDLMLLDLGMPDLDGLTILSEVRQRNDSMLIIIVTARDGLRDQVESFQLGANDYITKPFSFNYLLDRIQTQLKDGE